MIEKALNKLGYYKATIHKNMKVSEAEIFEVFRTYGGTKHFKTLLHNLSERDRDLYFQASCDEDRRKIRGAYERTQYFISLIQKSNDQPKADSKPERKR